MNFILELNGKVNIKTPIEMYMFKYSCINLYFKYLNNKNLS